MAGNVIDRYLTELDRRMATLDARVAGCRTSILAEIADGLSDSVEYHRGRGLTVEEARRAAVAEFGEVSDLAREFAPEIAARRVRRYGFGLTATGPLIGVAWSAAALAGSFAVVPLWLTVAGIAALVGIALVVAPINAYITAAMGSAGRWIHLPCHAAARRLLVSAVGTMVIDVSLVTVLVAVLLLAPAAVSVVPATAAAVLSVIRIGVATRSVQRLAAVRAMPA
ncbi:permease prefix domain 1-containing protein [Nocardia alni]|uniref:permease prefix domain 1-containing protein n=1 Tax=Nocardia alni TaxID=2815723 RepID=UPI001C21769B|nr:permease prefix domain 1-containing protein [Nocardia alni]